MSHEAPIRVTYELMWRSAYTLASNADERLRQFARLEDALDPVHPVLVTRAKEDLAVWTAIANLIGWCERNADYVKKSIAKEAAEQAAREQAAGTKEDAA